MPEASAFSALLAGECAAHLRGDARRRSAARRRRQADERDAGSKAKSREGSVMQDARNTVRAGRGRLERVASLKELLEGMVPVENDRMRKLEDVVRHWAAARIFLCIRRF